MGAVFLGKNISGGKPTTPPPPYLPLLKEKVIPGTLVFRDLAKQIHFNLGSEMPNCLVWPQVIQILFNLLPGKKNFIFMYCHKILECESISISLFLNLY